MPGLDQGAAGVKVLVVTGFKWRSLEHRSSCVSLLLREVPYWALPASGGPGTGEAAPLAASPLGSDSRSLLG